jgi:hypothetical protein
MLSWVVITMMGLGGKIPFLCQDETRLGLKVIQLDNGRFHKVKQLKIPDNIILLFQPPYCPE